MIGCDNCDHVPEDYEKCYPELVYKNDKQKRDNKGVIDFMESGKLLGLMEMTHGDNI